MADVWMQLYTGKRFDLGTEKGMEVMTIPIVAHSLSRMPRFCGHCRTHYSVANHLVLCYRLAKLHTNDKDVLRQVFCHDFAECVLCDMISPIKQRYQKLAAAYAEVEYELLCLFGKRFGFTVGPWEMPLDQFVRDVDVTMLYIEHKNKMIMDTCESSWAVRPMIEYPDAFEQIWVLSHAGAVRQFCQIAEDLELR